MPIKIEYGPIGLAGGLATMAGQVEAQKTAFAQGLQSDQLNMARQIEANRVAAQGKAFQLQMAVAERELAAKTRTPVTSHITAQPDAKQDQRKQFEQQLDQMVEAGIIDDAQRKRGMVAYTTGSKPLMAEVLAAPKPAKPAISAAQEVNIIRDRFEGKRSILAAELATINRDIPLFSGTPRLLEPLVKRAKAVQDKINTLDEAEAAEYQKIRGGSPQGFQAVQKALPPVTINSSAEEVAAAVRGATTLTPATVLWLKRAFGGDIEVAGRWLQQNGYKGL